MTTARWALAILLGGLWLLIAGFNAWSWWRQFVKREDRVPSGVLLVGAFVAWLGVTAWPWESALKGFVFWSALILDVGSLPSVLLFIAALLKGRIRSG